MENSCVVNCPCCGQFIQIEFSIMGARAYPFLSNFYNTTNATHGAIYKQDKEENDNG